jgi:hypothetical protein
MNSYFRGSFMEESLRNVAVGKRQQMRKINMKRNLGDRIIERKYWERRRVGR